MYGTLKTMQVLSARWEGESKLAQLVSLAKKNVREGNNKNKCNIGGKFFLHGKFGALLVIARPSLQDNLRP